MRFAIVWAPVCLCVDETIGFGKKIGEFLQGFDISSLYIQGQFILGAGLNRWIKQVIPAPIRIECQGYFGVFVFGGLRNLTTPVICKELRERWRDLTY